MPELIQGAFIGLALGILIAVLAVWLLSRIFR